MQLWLPILLGSPEFNRRGKDIRAGMDCRQLIPIYDLAILRFYDFF